MTSLPHPERDLVLDLAYGELPEREARRLRAHLEACADCRSELERIEGTRRLMSALPLEQAPERGERILLAAAREAAGRARPRWRMPGWLAGSLALAATVVVVTVVSIRIARESAGPLGAGHDPNALLPTPAPAEARRSEDSFAKAPEERAVASAQAQPPSAPPARPSPGRLSAPKAAGPRYAEPPPAVSREEDLARRDNAARPHDEEREAKASLKAEEPGLAGAPAGAMALQAPASSAEMEAPRAAAAKRAAPAAAGGSAAADLARPNGSLGPAATAPDVRTFPGCAGESRREIGRDAAGRVVRYVREGSASGRRVRVELAFGPDGRLVRTQARDLDTGVEVPGEALPGLPRSAAEVDPGAAPRCGP